MTYEQRHGGSTISHFMNVIVGCTNFDLAFIQYRKDPLYSLPYLFAKLHQNLCHVIGKSLCTIEFNQIQQLLWLVFIGNNMSFTSVKMQIAEKLLTKKIDPSSMTWFILPFIKALFSVLYKDPF